ncbi:MAG TPA: FecR domain-containing protein [Stellaceae bacterium]|nr:FecR domain-containing protein [Stellaceae bacterium]
MVAGLLLTAAGASALAAEERVGINSAVNPDATGAPPGAIARKLAIGQDVIFNEHITTTATGQTQILFLDESSMTVGPSSDLTIDQFVYDPKTGTGKLAMSATRGLMRYVGGRLSKTEDAVTLRTETATLAVRGGSYLAKVDSDKTEAAFLYGNQLKVAGAVGNPQIIKRPGWGSTVPRGGAASDPFRVPPQRLAQDTLQLDGRSGSTGGATVIPTDAKVVSSGVPQTISDNLSGSVQQAQSQSGTPPAPQANSTNPAPSPSIVNTVQSTATNTGQSTTNQPAPLPFSTSLADLNTLMRTHFNATYIGSASGSVNNNGLTYSAGGSFTSTFNFGTGFGTWTVTNFDGTHTFSSSGTTSLHNTANYSFSIVQRGVAGIVSGTFFGPLAAETGGNFSLHMTVGPTYSVSGIFSGKR